MQQEFKHLKSINRRLLPPDTYKKLKKIKSKNEFNQVSQDAILSYFKNEAEKLEQKISKLEEEGKNPFFAKIKLLIIPSKLSFFKVDFDKKELNKLLRLLNEVKEEISYHESI